MNPEAIKSFVTYYLQGLKERTRREKDGTKWGLDWVAYNIGLARFGAPVRLPFTRHGAEGFPKSKSEAEFGIDIAFVSDDGSQLTIFVLKDEPLSNKTFTSNDFDRDLRMACSPDLEAEGLERVFKVTIILAYNKDEQQNGIEAYERLVGALPKQISDKISVAFERWNLSALVEQTLSNVLSPSLLPERFFGQLSYIAAQASDFRHSSDEWEKQLIPNWKRFLHDVLHSDGGLHGPALVPVAAIIVRTHARANPSLETGWIDLLEWAAIAMWNAAADSADSDRASAIRRFWEDFYVPELEGFYRSHIQALGVERSIDQLAAGTSVGVVASSQIAYWHLARLGLLSFAIAESSGVDTEATKRTLNEVCNWLVVMLNANDAAFRPILDIEHIQLFLVFEAMRNAGRLSDAEAFVGNLEFRLYLRRMADGEIPFIDSGNSLELVFEQVATRPEEPLISTSSSFLVLALLEMCCGLPEKARDDLLSRIHRHLVLGVAEVGEPGDRAPLDLMSWIPPANWGAAVLNGHVRDGEAVTAPRLADTREVPAAIIRAGLEAVVKEMRKVDSFGLAKGVPIAALILASLRHRSPLPPELWRRSAFPIVTEVPRPTVGNQE